MFWEERNRKVIPRWRDYRTTVQMGELARPGVRQAVGDEERSAIRNRREEWKKSKSLWHAADLVSSAFVVGAFDEAQDAAAFLLEDGRTTSKPLRRIAAEVLGIAQAVVADLQPANVDIDELARQVHHQRKLLREGPRDAIGWTDLARLYTLLGESEKALHAMWIAARLGGDSRFVVRSAARLFLHEREGLRALRLIRNAAGAQHDPWLLAAEIATSSAAGYPSLFAKFARARRDDPSIPEFHKSELTTALATLELENGKVRQARKLFRRSLDDPNENSLAQVEWAMRNVGGLELPPDVRNVRRSFEAQTHLSAEKGHWDDAVQQGVAWFLDQPFSKRPAIFTSYVASLVGKYDVSEEILRQSLQLNPGDNRLINNLAFALANRGDVEEASRLLSGVPDSEASGASRVALIATRGLVAFRGGVPNLGRFFYERAIDLAANLGVAKYRTMAQLYLAREELRAGTSHAPTALERALEAAEKFDEADVSELQSQVLAQAGAVAGKRARP